METMKPMHSRGVKRLLHVVEEFDAAKDTLPAHVQEDRRAILEVVADWEKYQALVASLQAHNYTLLHKIERLEAERDDWRALAYERLEKLTAAGGAS